MTSDPDDWLQFAEKAFNDNKEWIMWLALLWWAECLENQNDRI